MNERIAKAVGPDRIAIAYERLGRESDPPVLLIMGVATQMVHWPEGFLEALVDRGLQVIRFDNRDSGRSTHIVDGPIPDMAAALAGDFSSASYTLSHMAADTICLADALDLESVHLVGASMGAYIAQTAAIEFPKRVRSLTSMMGTTGDPAVGQPHPETMQALFGGAPAVTREEVVAQAIRMAAIVGSPAYPVPEDEVANRARVAFERDHDPLAAARQGIASLASGDRTERLRQLDLPTLVIHGSADRMCDPSGGIATADAIPGARLMMIDGMGHNLPGALHGRIADAIAEVVQEGEE